MAHVTIESQFNQNLLNDLVKALGQTVTFTNGCSICLRDEEGMFWGVTPYGIPWGCNCDSEWNNKVIKWLDYWNALRDENGAAIETQRTN